MIISTSLVFLFGTAVLAGPLIPYHPSEIIISKHNNNLHEVEYLPPSGPHPFISNFIQKGTNVFFKPQFTMSSGHLPSQVQHVVAAVTKDDCEQPHEVVNEHLHIVEEEVIKEPPKIEHIVEIEKVPYPIPTIIESYQPVGIAEPPKHVIVEVEEPKKPVIVPPAPELPPFEMPELPVIVEEPHLQEEIPCDPPALVVEEVKPVIVAEVIAEVEEIHEPDVIPPAPVLPPMEMPEFPVLIEEHDTPCETPAVIAEVEEIHEPVIIPPAPVLPPMEMPELPILIEEHDEPCETPTVVEEIIPVIHREPVVEVHKDVVLEIEDPKKVVVIPPAPLLPPMELPELPIAVEEPHIVSELPCPTPPVQEIKPVIISHPPEPIFVEETHPIVLPPAPVLHPVEVPVYVKETQHFHELPKIPVYVEQVHEYNPIIVPTFSDFHKDKDCVDEILVERVLPRIQNNVRFYPVPAYPLPYVSSY